jgi:hypothetical protein
LKPTQRTLCTLSGESGASKVTMDFGIMADFNNCPSIYLLPTYLRLIRNGKVTEDITIDDTSAFTQGCVYGSFWQDGISGVFLAIIRNETHNALCIDQEREEQE